MTMASISKGTTPLSWFLLAFVDEWWRMRQIWRFVIWRNYFGGVVHDELFIRQRIGVGSLTNGRVRRPSANRCTDLFFGGQRTDAWGKWRKRRRTQAMYAQLHQTPFRSLMRVLVVASGCIGYALYVFYHTQHSSTMAMAWTQQRAYQSRLLAAAFILLMDEEESSDEDLMSNRIHNCWMRQHLEMREDFTSMNTLDKLERFFIKVSVTRVSVSGQWGSSDTAIKWIFVQCVAVWLDIKTLLFLSIIPDWPGRRISANSQDDPC